MRIVGAGQYVGAAAHAAVFDELLTRPGGVDQNAVAMTATSAQALVLHAENIDTI
jgi:hypothetical protein